MRAQGTARTNRSMFWRIVRQLLLANRGRLFVILLALGAGAAVSAALLNLQVDAKRRLTSEFRAFGANVVVSPAEAHASGNPTIDQSTLDAMPSTSPAGEIAKLGFVYVNVIVRVQGKSSLDESQTSSRVILAGIDGRNPQRVIPSEYVATGDRNRTDVANCRVGSIAARRLVIKPLDVLRLQGTALETSCYVSTIESFGGSEDSQIFTDWYTAGRLVGRPNRLSLIQLSIPGTPEQIQHFVTALQQKFPDLEVRPIRQFTEAEARIYNRISGLLTATVALVLVLTALCVMAAMTNVAMERKNDVGLMKAIGGATRRVLRLFLAEAAVLGLAGGVLGAAAGIAISIWLGKAVFGLAARPRLIVYPVAVALTIIVAIAGAFPLRRLANVRPASVFRGEA